MAHTPFIREIPGSHIVVLMIHGILGTPRHFDFLLSAVPENWSVYNILLDGHGGLVSDFSASSMKKWEHQTSTLVEKLIASYETLYIIGHSMGTLFAIDAALAHPEHVKGLLLLSPPLRVHPRLRVFRNALRVGLDLVREEDTAALLTKQAYSMEPDRHVWRYLGWIPRYLELFGKIRGTRRRLSMLKTPAYVFLCREDELVSVQSAKALAGCSSARVTYLPNSSHFAYTKEEASQIQQAFQHLYSAIPPFI